MALLHSGQDIAASVILGLLMGASGLEGFFNFCLGCVFFGLGIRFKLISPAVYRIYANTKDSVINGWHWANVEAAKATAPKEVVREAGSNGVQTKADLKYKRVKTDEYIVSDFHLIRNMQVCPTSLLRSLLTWGGANSLLTAFVVTEHILFHATRSRRARGSVQAGEPLAQRFHYGDHRCGARGPR